jgi:hypothetical protein
MATDVRVVPTLNDPTVDADWRTASQAIEAALLAVGLTKMGGPAQMDLATVAAPGTPPAYATGFHYWQFNDAKQATRPVYIRTAYGRAATNRFALKVLVAGGFTSAGATIGWAMTEETVAPTTPTVSPTVTLRTYHGSYGAWMCLTNSGSLTANSWLWSVHRPARLRGYPRVLMLGYLWLAPTLRYGRLCVLPGGSSQCLDSLVSVRQRLVRVLSKRTCLELYGTICRWLP